MSVRVAPYTVLYRKPQGKRVVRINQGEKVLVSGVLRQNGEKWNKVEFNGQEGFVKSTHLKLPH